MLTGGLASRSNSPESLSETAYLVSEYQYSIAIYSSIQALIWASAAITFPFISARLFVRWKVFHKFFIDDFFVVLAYLLLLVYAIYWQIRARDLYIVANTIPGPPHDSKFLHYFAIFITSEAISLFLHVFCLWFIKIAFLLFFRRLGQKVEHQKFLWWGACIYNMAAFAVWMGVVPWHCVIVKAQVALGKKIFISIM